MHIVRTQLRGEGGLTQCVRSLLKLRTSIVLLRTRGRGSKIREIGVLPQKRKQMTKHLLDKDQISFFFQNAKASLRLWGQGFMREIRKTENYYGQRNERQSVNP